MAARVQLMADSYDRTVVSKDPICRYDAKLVVSRVTGPLPSWLTAVYWNDTYVLSQVNPGDLQAMIKQQLLRVPGVRPAVEGTYRQLNRRDERRRQREIEERDRRTLAELAGRTDLRLNVGSSGNHLEGWLSLDLRAPDAAARDGRGEGVAVREPLGGGREQ